MSGKPVRFAAITYNTEKGDFGSMVGDDRQTGVSRASRIGRRQFLARAGVGVGAGAAAGLAGCSSSSGGQSAGSSSKSSGQSGSSGNSGLKVVPEIDLYTWTQKDFPQLFQWTRIVAQEMRSQLGLKVKMTPYALPEPAIKKEFVTRDFDMATHPFAGDPSRIDPVFYLNKVYLSSNDRKYGWNMPGYHNPTFDKLAEQQVKETDEKKRQQLVYKLQKIIHDDVPSAVVTYHTSIIAVNTKEYEEPSGPDFPLGTTSHMRWALSKVYKPKSGVSRLSSADDTPPSSISPFGVQNEIGVRQMAKFYDTLTVLSPKGPTPWIVNDVTVKDPKTVEVTVVDGHTFHDGKPLTGEDVAFSYNYEKEHKISQWYEFLKPLDKATADGQTVTFHLKNAYAPFLTTTMPNVPIIPKHIWEGISKPNSEKGIPPNGSGLFKYKSWRRGTVMQTETFKSHPQAPSYDGYDSVEYGSGTAMTQALLNGKNDFLRTPATSMYSDIKKNPNTALIPHKTEAWYPIHFNLRRGKPFSDLAFRKAVSHVVPRERIIKQVYKGYGQPGGSVIAEANTKWHNPTVKPRSYSPSKAKSILKDAGYEWNGTGRLMMPTN